MTLKRSLLVGAVWVAATVSPAPDVRTDAESTGPAVLTRAGEAWSWLGESASPQLVPGVDSVVDAAVLRDQVLVVRASGSVWTSGASGVGLRQLVPMPRVRSLRCGRDQCLMVTGSDRVVSWAGGSDVTAVPGLEDVAAVAQGGEQAVAVTHSGRVWAWSSRDGAAPTPVREIVGAVSVAAGSRHQLATSSDGTVWAWGANESGQLGTSTPSAHGTPARVPGIMRAVEVAARGDASYALTEDGEVWTFGGGNPVPVRVDSPGEIVRLHATPAGSLAERADGRFWSLATREYLPFPASIRRPATAPVPPAFGLTGTAALLVAPGPLADADAFVRARLEALGLTTRVMHDFDLAGLNDVSVVVISSSVEARALDGVALARLEVPVVTWERFLFAPMGLTRRETLPSHGSTFDDKLSIIRPRHPLAAGLQGHLEVLGSPASLTTGWTTADAEVVAVARRGGPGIFAYEAGSLTAEGTAPARRVGFFMTATGEPLLNEAGVALFDAAIRWAVEPATGEPPGADGGVLGPEGLGTILLVVGGGAPPQCTVNLSPGDAVYRSRMEGLGFTVVVESAACATASQADGKAMVFVSHTSPNNDLDGEFWDVETPVAIQNPGILHHMQMTLFANRGPCTPLTSNTTVVLDPSHPIANGLNGTQTMSTSSGAQEWGTPSVNARKVLMCDGNNSHSTTFTYERGVEMVNGVHARERRTYWSFHAPIPNTFTPIGGDLFDRMILWTSNTQNQPPVVNAGPDQAATACERELCHPITLPGHVFDDGLPNGQTMVEWHVISGTGQVTFDPVDVAVTEATFFNTGPFLLMLEAKDGEFTSQDYVLVTVYGEGSNEPPAVDAGPDQVAIFGTGVITLQGMVTDEGLPNPPGVVTVAWSKLSGPGTVDFGSPLSPVTTASFSHAGQYILRLTASDSELTAYDDVVVTANKAALLVVGNSQPLTAGDAVLKSRMEALGFPVVVKRESETGEGDALNKAFVWLSSTMPGNVMTGSTFAEATTPVVVQSAGYVDNLRMTTGATGTSGVVEDQTSLTVTQPTHPLSAGLQGTAMTSGLARYSWGIPIQLPGHPPKGVVRVLPDPQRFAVFAYETGDPLNSAPEDPPNFARERRLFFGIQDAGLATLTSSGKHLLDAAILWSGRTNAAPWVDAGPPRGATLSPSGSTFVIMGGRVIDDGLPAGSIVITQWSKAGGPGHVEFQNEFDPTSRATFTVPGNYLLRLTATDGQKTSSDLTTVVIRAQGVNAPPTVIAGPDQTIRLGQSVVLRATGSDDGVLGPLTASWTKVFGPTADVIFSAPNAFTTLATPTAAGVYVLRVTVSDFALSSFDEVRVTVEPHRPALLVVHSATQMLPDDIRLEQELRSLGFNPTVRGQTVNPAEANDKDLVVISSSVESGNVNAGFQSVTRPVVVLEWGIYPLMGMAPEGIAVGGTEVAILRPEHPLAAGLASTRTVYNGPGLVVGCGMPASSAIVVAKRTDGPQATVFAYERGSTMVSGTALARRVGFFGGNAASLTSDGLALLRAAVAWATERPVSVLLVTAAPAPSASELAIKERIAALGYGVDVIHAAAAVPAHAQNKAFVVVAKAQAGATFRDTTTAVIVWEGSVMAAMGMVPPTGGFGTTATQSAVSIIEPTHPLAGALQGQVGVVSPADTFTWSLPGPGATRAATLANDAGRTTVFGYEVGASLPSVPGSAAADRRIGLFLGPASGAALTLNGGRLLEAAFGWAGDSDPDQDGLGTADEYRLGTDPRDADTNDDGLPDGASVAAGVSPTSLDHDGDGLTNAFERLIGTDPFDHDTDDDGSHDGADCYPLDPTFAVCPPPVPGPPVIQLHEPANAQLVNSVP